MPQMAPMWWSTLFLIMIITFMMVMMTMYFYNIYNPMNSSKKMNSNTKNITWKW